jgi:16S rRNA processing protein RimM
MEKIFVGKIINSFGLKGELKVLSSFEMKEKVFMTNNKIYIDEKEYLITSSRFHKGNYLITIDNLNDINLVESFRNKDLFFNKEDLHLNNDNYLLSDLINFAVYDDKLIGQVTAVSTTKINPLILVNNQFYIPLNGDFITKIDLKSKRIDIHNLKGLLK